MTLKRYFFPVFLWLFLFVAVPVIQAQACSDSGNPARTGTCAPNFPACPAGTQGPAPTNDCGAGICCIGAAAGGPAGPVGGYANPLQFTDAQTFLTAVLLSVQGIIVVLAVVFIIIGALIYITSGGNESRVTWAKGAILAAVVGLALAIAAPLFLREIGSILGWLAPSADLTKFGTQLTLSQVLGNILAFLLGIIGVVAILGLVIGAFLYLTAAGEPDRADTGKRIVTYAIIGIAVALAGLVIIRQVAQFFT